MFFLDIDAHASQLRDDVPSRSLAVVGQQAERDVSVSQLLNEGISAGDELRPSVEYAVHVDKVALLHVCTFALSVLFF